MSHSPEYLKRIASADWQRLRADLIYNAGYVCERCGMTCVIDLEVHHKTYDRLGHEHRDDLEVLCPPCHKTADRERQQRVKRERWNRRVTAYARAMYGYEDGEIIDPLHYDEAADRLHELDWNAA